MTLPSGSSADDLDALGAQSLEHKAAGIYLALSIDKTIRKATPEGSFQRYLETLLAEYGSPTDPVERMLIEQLAIVHHVIGRLHAQANYAASPEEAEVHLGSAARLTAEMRRTALALRQYRQGPAQQLTVISQQSLVAGQQVAIVAGTKKALPAKRPKKAPRNKLSGPAKEALAYERQQPFPILAEAPPDPASVVRSGPRAKAADRPAGQALAALDGAQDA